MENDILKKSYIKNEYFQAIRGICICICAVVLIHCQTGLSYKFEMFPNNINYFYWIFSRQFLNFCVAIFFFLSGYFVNKEKVLCTTNGGYVKERFIRLCIPFLLWSFFYQSIRFFFAEKINLIEICKSLFFIFSGNGEFHLYFIFVLLQLILLTPLLLRRKNMAYVLIVLSIIFYLFRYFNLIWDNSIINNYSKCVFLPWVLFYLYGLFYNEGKNKNVFTNLIFAVFINVLEVILLTELKISENFVITQMKLSSVLYAFAVIDLIMFLKDKVQPCKVLVKIGDLSFGIYFIHVFYNMIYNKFLSFFEFEITNLLVMQVIQFTIVLCLSFFTVLVVRKYLPKISKVLMGV